MKRDLDLIRCLIGMMENGEKIAFKEPIRDWTAEQVAFHAWLLVDADLVHGTKSHICNSLYPMGLVTCLTWKGYEFADLIRDQGAWEYLKQKGKQAAGAFSYAIAFETLKYYAMNKMGLSNSG